jgi:hypothetical protein
MSAFTPKMAGRPVANPLDYAAAKNLKLDVPPILRLKPLERESQMTTGMHIKLASAPRTTDVAHTGQPVATPEVPTRAAVRADPELLQQIPGLKETLRALDSEMDATATSDMEKRLAVHARILELQGQQLSEVLHRQGLHDELHIATGRKALQTEATTNQLLGKMQSTEKTHALHTELHKAGGSRLLALDKSMQEMTKRSELHAKLHKAGGEGVLNLHNRLGLVEELNELHGKLHMASGAGLLDMKNEMTAAAKTTKMHGKLHTVGGEVILAMQEDIDRLHDLEKLHSKLHLASGSQVMSAREEVAKLKQTSQLHSQVHGAMGKNVVGLQKASNDLRTTSDIHSKIHKATAGEIESLQRDMNQISTNGMAPCTTRSVAPTGGMQDMQAEIDQLKATVKLHEEIHRSTTNIVKKLGGEALDVHADVSCDCDDERRVAARASAPSSAMLLSELTRNIAETNKPRKNRR